MVLLRRFHLLVVVLLAVLLAAAAAGADVLELVLNALRAIDAAMTDAHFFFLLLNAGTIVPCFFGSTHRRYFRAWSTNIPIRRSPRTRARGFAQFIRRRLH